MGRYGEVWEMRCRCHQYGEVWGGVGDEVRCRCHGYGEVWETRCGVSVMGMGGYDEVLN